MSFNPKNKRRRSDHGVDDWLMTYADMITLLLCFFAIFLSVSVPKAEQMEKARESVLEHFAAPDEIQDKLKSYGKGQGRPQNEKNSQAYDSLPSILDQFHSGEGRSVGSGVDAGEGQSEGMGEGPQQGIGQTEGMNENPQQQNGENGRENGDRDQEGQQGDRIRILEMPSAAFFASGSSALRDDGKALLQDILDQQLNTPELQDYQVTIEGHTDDVPINTLQFPSNWELSTSRAAAVVRFLIEHGVNPQRLRAAGYADIFPKAPNRDESGNAIPENQAQNRRVVIKLEKIEKEEQ